MEEKKENAILKNNKKYTIITFGCQMNERDSETLGGFLEERGYFHTASPKDADIVLVNTCSVRENADKRFFGTLGQLKKSKETKKDFKVGICGCMMQQEPIRKEIQKKYPWVDIVFGTHNIHEFPKLLDEITAKKEAGKKTKTIFDVWEDGKEIVEGMPYKPLHDFKAFVNVTLGCNNFCTYCIVPYTRGRERSRKAEKVVAEIKTLAARGVKEVTLLGQNVNSYRDGDTDFADLIYMIDDIQDIERIRFMTSHPKDLSKKLIEAFKDCNKLCKYIHLPVQSGSNNILKEMNRKYTREKYLQVVNILRETIPGITISTDIIVGFPGEREEDFQDTLDLVNEIGYDSAFTFLYSKRTGTPAATYPNQIPEEIKHQRFDRLVEAVNSHSAIRNKVYEGKRVKVLIEGESKRDAAMLSGRTDGFKLVNFQKPADEDLKELIGSIREVDIREGKTFSLMGELVD